MIEIRSRTISCFVCDRKISAQSMTGPHPECPELANFKEDSLWFGVIVGETENDPPWLLALCSQQCAERIATEGSAAALNMGDGTIQ